MTWEGKKQLVLIPIYLESLTGTVLQGLLSMRLSKGAAVQGKIGGRGLLVLFLVLPGGGHNPAKTEGRGKYWGPVKNPELLSPCHLLFLISSTNTVIGTTNYNNYSLAET